ncbi:Protein ECM21 [Nakaseomyces bracarensis]|uniref:Protein ECM21 n=1 Tax=Nakaseomyces bracarensis TaxID=273131 RepID=A0ABR4P0C3_9SACH
MQGKDIMTQPPVMISHNYHNNSTLSHARRMSSVSTTSNGFMGGRNGMRRSTLGMADSGVVPGNNYVHTSDVMRRSTSIPTSGATNNSNKNSIGRLSVPTPSGTFVRRHSVAEVTNKSQQPNLFAMNYLNDFLLNRGFLPQRSLYHKNDHLDISISTTSDPLFLPTNSIRDEDEYLNSVSEANNQNAAAANTTRTTTTTTTTTSNATINNSLEVPENSNTNVLSDEEGCTTMPSPPESGSATPVVTNNNKNNPFFSDIDQRGSDEPSSPRQEHRHSNNPFLEPSIMDSLNENNDLSLGSVDTAESSPTRKNIAHPQPKKTKRTHVSANMTPFSIAVIVSVKKKPIKVPEIIVNFSSNVSIFWYNGVPGRRGKYEEYYQLNSLNWKLNPNNYNVFVPADSQSPDDVQENLDIDVIRDYVVFKNKRTSQRTYIDNKKVVNNDLLNMLEEDNNHMFSEQSGGKPMSRKSSLSTPNNRRGSTATEANGNFRDTTSSNSDENSEKSTDDEEILLPGDYIFVIPIAFTNKAPESLSMPCGRVYYRLKILTQGEVMEDEDIIRVTSRPSTPISNIDYNNGGSMVTLNANDLDYFRRSDLSHTVLANKSMATLSGSPPRGPPPPFSAQNVDISMSPMANHLTPKHKSRQMSVDFNHMHSNIVPNSHQNSRSRNNSDADSVISATSSNLEIVDPLSPLKMDRRKRSTTSSWLKSIKNHLSSNSDLSSNSEIKSITGKISPMSMSRRSSVNNDTKKLNQNGINDNNRFNIFVDEPINIVRMHPERALTTANKPVYVNKVWADCLSYEVSFGKKYVPLESEIPLIIKLSPLVKDLEIKRVRVSVVETIKYYNIDRKYEYDQLDPILKDPFSPHYRDFIMRKKKTRNLPLLEIRTKEFGNKALTEEIVENCLNDNLLSFSSTVEEYQEFNKKRNVMEKKSKTVAFTEPICIETSLKFPKHVEIDSATNKSLPTYGVESFYPIAKSEDEGQPSRQNSMFSFFKSHRGSDAGQIQHRPELFNKTKIYTDDGHDVKIRTRVNGTNRGLYLDSSFFRNIIAKHKLEIMLRIKRYDDDDPTKFKNYEILIDTPIFIVSDHCNQGNTELPTYHMAVSDSTKLMLASGNPPPPTFEEATSIYSSPFASPAASPRMVPVATQNGYLPEDISLNNMSRSVSFSARSEVSIDSELPNVDHLMASLPPVPSASVARTVATTNYNNLDGMLSSDSSVSGRKKEIVPQNESYDKENQPNGNTANKKKAVPITPGITVMAAEELFKKDYSILTKNTTDIQEPPNYETIVNECNGTSNGQTRK